MTLLLPTNKITYSRYFVHAYLPTQTINEKHPNTELITKKRECQNIHSETTIFYYTQAIFKINL